MEQSEKIRVLIVDDHAVVRSGLSAFLLSTDDLKLVAQAGSGEEAIALCESVNPDVILMDLVMGGIDGAETTQRIRERHPQIQIVVLTSFPEEDLVARALRAGAIGYLLKNASADELADAIRRAHRGRPTLSPEAAQALIHITTGAPPVGHDLTTREREVLSLMSKGLNNTQIAEKLIVSRSTIKFHVSNILSKLGVKGRTEAVALAIETQILSSSSSN